MTKKTSKKKIPKVIAGVKIPKELRKASRGAMKMADHPVVTELVAAALLAAAAALRDTSKTAAAAGAVGEGAADAATGAVRAAGKARIAAKAAAGAIGKGILDEINAILDGAASKPVKRGGSGKSSS